MRARSWGESHRREASEASFRKKRSKKVMSKHLDAFHSLPLFFFAESIERRSSTAREFPLTTADFLCSRRARSSTSSLVTSRGHELGRSPRGGFVNAAATAGESEASVAPAGGGVHAPSNPTPP